ncbi:MAG: 4-hydroxythreonine-4-phosphate dehydrogenase [Pelagibacterium sp. SCN 64-44]|nr:MAG: 4-hydroxythreonine-4-phosphate dehydrogenase [Pelagibacterium sp. SCN 64-44]
MAGGRKPRLALIPGDPCGIGPELIAKLVSLPQIAVAADILLIGDAHIFQQGAKQAALDLKLEGVGLDGLDAFHGIRHLDIQTVTPGDVRVGQVTQAGGHSALRCLDKALDLAQEGQVDAILFAPFNKAAMTLAGLNAEDEHRYIARYLGFEGYHSELNVLDELMTTRVTSHIALRDVADAITPRNVLLAIGLAHDTLLRAGHQRPRIGVAALNPHAGDNGKFGREEIEILTPAIDQANGRGMQVTGPWPSDTIFLRAQRGEMDAVVTMYHDQGQIAIKLLGFERGVTVAGGLPFPIATPAHGTAFDIAGQNKANLGATRQAFDLLVRMVAAKR